MWLDREGGSKINTGVGFLITCWIRSPPTAVSAWKSTSRRPLYRRSPHRRRYRPGAGRALKIALGDKRGICRFGFVLPWTNALPAARWISLVARTWNKSRVYLPTRGRSQHRNDRALFRSLSYTMGVTLHLKTKGKKITTV